MKKFIALLALVSTSAMAQHHHHGGYGSNWIAPMIIGGVIGYGMKSSQQPVYINSQPVYNLPTPAPTYGATPIYEKRTQYDPNCNCYVVIYNQIGWQ